MSLRRWTLPCVALALAATAAGGGAQRGPALATTPVPARKRVEAGVTILEHDQTAFARATKLALVAAPVMVAGGADGDPDFDLTRASNIVLLSDGRLATFARVGNKFFIFGADGRGERSLGRTGQGPGEFMAIGNMIGLAGDTLFMADASNNRLNWVSPDRGVVRSKPIEAGAHRPASNAAGALPGGRLVMYSSGLVLDGVRDSVTRPPASVEVWPASGPRRTVATIPDLEIAMVETRYRGRKAVSSTVVQFTRTALVAVWDTLIATAYGDGYRIDVRNSAGTITSRIVVAGSRRPVTSSMRAAFVDARLKFLRGPRSEQMVDAAESERLAREQPSADSIPPYQQMFVSPGKTLWVVDYVAPTDTSWAATAFRTDGAIIGRLRGSGKATPVAFGDDRVVVRAADADGIVSLSVHRIVVDRSR